LENPEKDLLYYFNAREGFKTLVASLDFNANALVLLQELLEAEPKL